MDAIHFCHVHHSCVQGVAWVRQWNEAHHPQKLTLLQAFDIAPTGRWCTWAWLACARRHSICNVFNVLHMELGLNSHGTLKADEGRDKLSWAMGEKCSALHHAMITCNPIWASLYMRQNLGIEPTQNYDDICDAMQGKVSSIIKELGRYDVEAYDRDHI